MPIIISSAVVLSDLNTDPDLPLIGYDNVVTTSNIAATSAATGSPPSNLANPATHLKWIAGNTDSPQYLTITLDGLTEIGYVAAAGHNWGSSGATVSIEQQTDNSPEWEEVAGTELIPADDTPLIWWITPSLYPNALRIKIVVVDESPGIEPEAAVVYAGVPLRLERKLYADHTPISQARRLDVSNGRSESGEFLGRVVKGEWRETTASFRLFTPAWYRENMPDFLDAAKTKPFFFAWRPNTYPLEVGYCFLMDDPMPKPVHGDGNLIAFELKLGGVV